MTDDSSSTTGEPGKDKPGKISTFAILGCLAIILVFGGAIAVIMRLIH